MAAPPGEGAGSITCNGNLHNSFHEMRRPVSVRERVYQASLRMSARIKTFFDFFLTFFSFFRTSLFFFRAHCSVHSREWS